MIYLGSDIIRKNINENERPDKVIDINQKILLFNEKKKVTRLKILTYKLMLQRLSTAFAKVRAGNTSERLLNEIHQIIYIFVYCKRN